MKIPFHPQSTFDAVLAAPAPAPLDPELHMDLHVDLRLRLVAELCRANALAAIKLAGSGHMGSSLSALDLFTWLHFKVMNTLALSAGHPDRDIFFSSKGHDAPGYYAVLHAAGRVQQDMLLALRRRGGLEGHPVVGQPGIEAGTGSLGMGLSKGAGMAEAKALLGRGGRVFVLTGDGELQEGQNYEALRRAAARGLGRLVAVVDCNRVQSDRSVEDTAPLGDLGAKFASFGWAVETCDGHGFRALDAALARLDQHKDKPKAIIAETIKGRGVSFMEHPRALAEGHGLYRWHSGAPTDELFCSAHAEVTARVDALALELGLALPAPLLVDRPEPQAPTPTTATPATATPTTSATATATPAVSSAVSPGNVAAAYGRALAELGAQRPELVVLDGDLAGDCRLDEFRARFPERFFEIGIAEQDMVSAAGGMALQGLLPVVNSFAAFLASRANEQIYANACEGTKIIYACHYGGLLPAAAGMSHQSVRDVSLLGAIPGFLVVEPSDEQETADLLAYLVHEAKGPAAIRLHLGPSPAQLPFPPRRGLKAGQGTLLEGSSQADPTALVFAYGPVFLAEVVKAAEACADLHVGVIAMPWLNRIDADWLEKILRGVAHIFVVDDHSLVGGLGSALLAALHAGGLLTGRSFTAMGVEGLPACGQAAEVLRAHGLDGMSLAARIRVQIEGHGGTVHAR